MKRKKLNKNFRFFLEKQQTRHTESSLIKEKRKSTDM